MKLILLSLSMMFFLTSCEDVDDSNSASPINSFKKIESSLFESNENANNYLIISSVDSVTNLMEVETYYETPATGRRNTSIKSYTCNSSICTTDTIGKNYYLINSSDSSEQITVEKYEVQNDGTEDQLTSKSTYILIED